MILMLLLLFEEFEWIWLVKTPGLLKLNRFYICFKLLEYGLLIQRDSLLADDVLFAWIVGVFFLLGDLMRYQVWVLFTAIEESGSGWREILQRISLKVDWVPTRFYIWTLKLLSGSCWRFCYKTVSDHYSLVQTYFLGHTCRHSFLLFILNWCLIYLSDCACLLASFKLWGYIDLGMATKL